MKDHLSFFNCLIIVPFYFIQALPDGSGPDFVEVTKELSRVSK